MPNGKRSNGQGSHRPTLSARTRIAGGPRGLGRDEFEQTGSEKRTWTSTSDRPDLPCPDCNYHDRIDGTGKPRFQEGVLRTAGCESCNGTGRVPAEKYRDRIDPYMIPKKG